MRLEEKCARDKRARQLMEAGCYPYFLPIEASTDTEVVVGGRRCIMLGSNNYLGLTHDPRIVEAAQAAIAQYGAGVTGSRFLNGNLDLHEQLEGELADFFGTESALVFSTGYQANVGVISALIGRTDRVFLDKLDHASIVDACRMSQAEIIRFAHNDLNELRARLDADRNNGHARGDRYVVVDGIFSMEGDVADVAGLVSLCRDQQAVLVVDEAHAVGVLGPRGAGTAEHFGVVDQVDVLVGTFSKSFASIGGFAAGSAGVMHFLRHNARSLMFSAGLPPSAVATALKALDIIRTEPERRERLWAITRRMAGEYRRLGFETGPSETPIVPIYSGTPERTLELWAALFEEGVYTNPILAPAVPAGECRLRTSFIATHSDAQLDRALDVFERVGRRLGFVR